MTKLVIPTQARTDDGKRLDPKKLQVMQDEDATAKELREVDKTFDRKAKEKGMAKEKWEMMKQDKTFDYMHDDPLKLQWLEARRKVKVRHTPSPEEEFDEDMKKEGGTPAKIRQKKKW